METYTILLYLYFVVKKLVIGAGLVTSFYLIIRFIIMFIEGAEGYRDYKPSDFLKVLKIPFMILVVIGFIRAFIPSNEQMIALVTVEAVQRSTTTEEAQLIRSYLLKELRKLNNKQK